MDELTMRQRAILRQVEDGGFVTVEGLADTFGVSAQTVRRDIIALDAAGLLQRFHGGAGFANPNGERLRLGPHKKRSIAVDEKTRIADAVAAQIAPGAAVFLDVGSTMEVTATALDAVPGVQVVTNSMRVADRLDHRKHDIIVLPGHKAGQDGSLVGEATVLALAGWRLDVALIGCSAVEVGGAALDHDLRKVAVKQVAMQVARRTLLLATPEKFGRSARAVIASLTQFDDVIDGR